MRTAALGLMATMGLAACGEDARSPEAASRPDAAIVRSLPDPFEPGARQPPGAYVGKVGRAGWTYVGVIVRGDRAVVYLCDGRASEWLGARVRDQRVLVRGASGTVVDADVGEGVVRGSVRPRGQPAARFSARPPRDGAGVFSGPDPAVPGRVRRWIVLEDGVRGVSDAAPPAGDEGAGSGPRPTRTAAPTSTATPITITPTPTATPTPTPTPNSINIPEPTATPTATTNIQDGTSNTILPGESTATPTPTGTRPPGTGSVADGTSNTIVFGESTATPTPAGTRPPGTGSVADGTSNTILLGESTATPTPTSTATPIPPAGSIPDGTSNTILFGEAPVNGVAAGGDAPPPAPAATTCPKDMRCPPPAPPKDEPAGGSVSGGKLLPCPVLETLIKTLLAPARTDAVARRQLSALTAQAKANEC